MSTLVLKWAQWCWHLLPLTARSRLYRGYCTLVGRTVAFIQVVIQSLTLADYREQVRALWPNLAWRDLQATTLVFFALRFHAAVLSRSWRSAGLLRAVRGPRSRAAFPPLRVMHITSSFDLGGTQRQIKQLCLSPAARFEHVTTEIFPEFNFLYRRGVMLEPSRYVRGGALQRAVGRCLLNLGTRSPQLIQTYKLVRDFQAYRPDVVVGWGHEMCATTFLAATVARVPYIVFCIRTFNPAYGWTDAAWGRQLGIAHRAMTPRVSAIITNSTPLQDDYARWVGIDPARIEVCPNGIEIGRLDLDEMQARRRAIRAELGIDDTVALAINVGRFSAEKGQHTIITVNQRLRHDFPQLLWLLCGDGPTLEAVRRQADESGAANVRFLGRVDGVLDYLCAGDLFVMPSDFEGMPNAMMEAMACGLPCVSTDRSGAVDVARDGSEALFYKVGDLATLERHLRFLLEQPGEARAIGARARARVAEFSVERSLERFEQIIDAAIVPS